MLGSHDKSARAQLAVRQLRLVFRLRRERDSCLELSQDVPFSSIKKTGHQTTVAMSRWRIDRSPFLLRNGIISSKWIACLGFSLLCTQCFWSVGHVLLAVAQRQRCSDTANHKRCWPTKIFSSNGTWQANEIADYIRKRIANLDPMFSVNRIV